MRTLAILVLAALSAAAQGFGGESDLPSLSGRIISVEPKEVAPGGRVVAKVELEIPQGWHIYGLVKGTSSEPTVFEVASGPFTVVAGEVKEPKPQHKVHTYPNGKSDEYDYHEGPKVVFEVALDVARSAPKGQAELVLSVKHMLCTDRTCLEPTSLNVSAKVTVVEGSDANVAEAEPVLTGGIESVGPSQAKMGDTVVAKVKVKTPPGWHIYGLTPNETIIPTSFKVLAGPFAVKGAVKEPKPLHHKEVFETGLVIEYDYHEGEVVFEVPLVLTAEAKPGATELKLAVHHMLCADACLEATDLVVASTFTVLEGGAPPNPDQPAKRKGLLAFLGLAFLTGLVTLITPCVFPMIPITVSYFTKQSAGSRSGALGLASAYGIGIIVSYTAIGFIVSLLLGEDGAARFAGNPWVNLVIATVFVAFGLSLLGWFELTLPGGLTNALSAQGKGGMIGALALGLTFSITAFTCAAPFAASLLALAVQGERTWAILGFLTYSTTMAVPFFLLGLFPQALKSLPRSGGWLQSVKVVMGFIEIAAACKFLAVADVAWHWGLISRSGVLAIWIMCAALSSLYLLGVFRLGDEEPQPSISVPRMLWALVFGSVALWLSTGLFGARLGTVEGFLPLRDEDAFGARGTGGSEEKEIGSHAEALKAGQAQKKPVFLEFTAFN